MEGSRSIRLLDEELLDELERLLARQPGGLVSHAPPGLPRDEITAALQRHGVAPSREAVLWWSWRDGSSLQVLPGFEHFTFAGALDGLGRLLEMADEASYHYGDPERWWNPGWLPIFGTGGLSKIAIDCTGEPDGPAPLRQIDWDSFGADHYARAFAPSLGDFIARVIRTLSSGRYHYDPDQNEWLPMDWANTSAGERF